MEAAQLQHHRRHRCHWYLAVSVHSLGRRSHRSEAMITSTGDRLDAFSVLHKHKTRAKGSQLTVSTNDSYRQLRVLLVKHQNGTFLFLALHQATP